MKQIVSKNPKSVLTQTNSNQRDVLIITFLNMLAVEERSQDIEAFEWLLNMSGVDINDVMYQSGHSLLMVAVEQGSLEIVRYLVERHGIDTGIISRKNETALTCAWEGIQRTIYEEDDELHQEYLKIMQFLIGHKLSTMPSRKRKEPCEEETEELSQTDEPFLKKIST